MARSSGRSQRRRNSGSHRRRVPPVAGPSYFELALSLLEGTVFHMISLIIQKLPNEHKSKIIQRILGILVRYFLSNDRYNFWDRLFDHVKSHHSFHTTCRFTHVGRFTLPKVRNQGRLATCFIISTCGSVSSLVRRLKRFWVVLAVQQLIDHFDVTEKDGGLTSEAYEFIENNGIVEEEHYPFTGAKDTPQNPKCRRFFIGGHKYLGRASREVVKDQFERTPVTASMVYYSVFRTYKGGIIDVPQRGKFTGMHSVLITGFGVSKTSGREYFEFQNSHGYDWGFFGSGKVFADLLCDFRVPKSGGDKTVVDP